MGSRLLVAALACLASSCGYVEATSVQYVGVPRYARVEPATVKVLPGEPRERHERLGEVKLDISVDPAPSVADVEDKLREEAAKMGANAIYVIRDVARPGEDRKLIGIAIRVQQ